MSEFFMFFLRKIGYMHACILHNLSERLTRVLRVAIFFQFAESDVIKTFDSLIFQFTIIEEKLRCL